MTIHPRDSDTNTQTYIDRCFPDSQAHFTDPPNTSMAPPLPGVSAWTQGLLLANASLLQSSMKFAVVDTHTYSMHIHQDGAHHSPHSPGPPIVVFGTRIVPTLGVAVETPTWSRCCLWDPTGSSCWHHQSVMPAPHLTPMPGLKSTHTSPSASTYLSVTPPPDSEWSGAGQATTEFKEKTGQAGVMRYMARCWPTTVCTQSVAQTQSSYPFAPPHPLHAPL